MGFKTPLTMRYLRTAKFAFHKLIGGQEILHCIGDSHVQNFRYLAQEYLLPRTDLRFCVVQGATNMGLANPHSQTQAMPIFMEYLNKVAPSDYVAFCLGEVDCGFVIWYRADKHGTSVKDQFELSLKNYFGLIDKYLEKVATHKVIICSTPLPTIPDHQLVRGEVANKRLSISATQKQRTDLTLEYNHRLQDFCKKRGLQYLDMDYATLDKRSGLVSEDFLNKDPLNHHLEPEKLAPLIVDKLNNFGLN